MKLPASTMASAYRAGQSAGQNYVDIHRETNKYANKPNEINKVAYQAQMAEKKIATEIDARAKKNEIKAQSITDRADVKADLYNKRKAADKSKRKAGIVAGIGMIASDMITENKMGKAPRRERDDFSSIDSYMESIKSKFEADRAKELATPLDTSTPVDTSKPSTPTTSSNANASVNTAALNSKPVGGGGIGGTDMDYMSSLVGKGYQPLQAAAIVGNARYESGDFKFAEELAPNAYGTRGYGALQWTNAGGSNRRDDFMNYAKSNDLSPTSFEANAGFISHEMTHGDSQGRTHWTGGSTLGGFKGMTDLGAATDYYAKNYLRPAAATANYEKRRSNAMDTYTRYMQSQ